MGIVGAEPRQQRHDDRHRSLVVGPEHAGAVAEQDVFAGPTADLGVVGDAQPDVLIAVQAEILALEAQDLRADDGREARIDRVEMSDEADPWRAGRLPRFTAVTVA